MNLSKEDKQLKKAIESGSLAEVKKVLAKSNQPIDKKQVIPVLRCLIGRSKFDFSVVDLLKKRGCDLNPTLESDYRLGDYLSYFGRLSPRLISEMGKAGYSFSKQNEKGEDASFYLIASLPLNKKVISALKAQGLDFKQKNKNGKTAVETMISAVQKYACGKEITYGKSLVINRFSGLLDTPEELNNLNKAVSEKGKGLQQLVQHAIDKIEPKPYENIGILDIYEDMKDAALISRKILSTTVPLNNAKQRVREGD